jgi:hypothetical protein
MIEHAHYEELCGLAAIGEVSEAELQDLRFHLADCNDCRERLVDFSQLSAQVIPLGGERYAPVAIPAGMTDRFRENARRAGLPMAPAPVKLFNTAWLRPGVVAVMCACSLLLIAGTFFTQHAALNKKATVAAAQAAPSAVAAPSANVSVAEGKKTLAIASAEPGVSAVADSAELQQLREELALLKRDNADTHAEREQLNAKIAQLTAEVGRAQEDAGQQMASVAQLKQQLEKKQGMDAADIVTLAEKDDRIKALQSQAAQRDVELAQARSLLAASDQARDLIVARNLHIIDVHDSNGSGTHQLPFGRIFYTEGKSLVFYAYDLQNPGTARDASLSFHVWGGKLGDTESAKSLGIFRNESANDGRWVLTCDDPRVLAQVNTVFVTTETRQKNSDGPRGKRILYAFLGDRPNHP